MIRLLAYREQSSTAASNSDTQYHPAPLGPVLSSYGTGSCDRLWLEGRDKVVERNGVVSLSTPGAVSLGGSVNGQVQTWTIQRR